MQEHQENGPRPALFCSHAATVRRYPRSETVAMFTSLHCRVAALASPRDGSWYVTA